MYLRFNKLKSILKKTVGLKWWIRFRELLFNEKLYNKSFDEKKCIFIHIPKAAGTSIGEALFNNGRTGHYEWRYYKIDKIKFHTYFKFAFVRNPYDRLVSSYFYLQQGGKNKSDHEFNDRVLSKYLDFEDFVLNGLDDKEVSNWGHFKKQSDFIYDDVSKSIVVDYLGYFENISEDYNNLRYKLGGAKLGKANPSNRNAFTEYYTKEMADKVFTHYNKDFELFNYEKDINNYR
jgi:hypothetical protein|tara:strand:+ start:4306 stop:5004 length:699 start_codon:yes stop_codon:yes gene_type:complete